MDDLRESASVKLIEYFNKQKINYEFSDPFIKNKVNLRSIKLRKKSLNISKQNLEKFDIAILMTDHDVFNYKMIYEHSRNIIDCRGRYSIDNKVTRA